jgi:hypothetical protein
MGRCCPPCSHELGHRYEVVGELKFRVSEEGIRKGTDDASPRIITAVDKAGVIAELVRTDMMLS